MSVFNTLSEEDQLRSQCVSSYISPKVTYTSSIYIKSSEYPCDETNPNTSPVLSQHRVNGIEEDNKVSIRVSGEENQVYITTAAIHRHSDISNQRSDSLRSNLNFVSRLLIDVK